jgi:hypothetical protein
MKTIQEIAQWVIDNRYPKSENNKVSDAEMYHTLIEAMNQVLHQPTVSEWHLFSDELPTEKEDILVRNGLKKEIRRCKWAYDIYINDLKKGMQWKRWADACH